MILSDDTKAVIALTTRLGDRHRPSLSAARWHTLWTRLADEGITPATLFSDHRLFDDDEVIRSLLEDAAGVLLEADQLAQRGIWVRSVADDDYPEHLRHLEAQTPPVIFGVGTVELLHEGGIGVVGSRDVSPDGADVARRIAEHAATTGKPLVSGGARGVDQLAMNAAHQAGGSVIGVLADSLQQRIRSTDTMRAIDAGATCLISVQHPGAGFSPAAAMARNKLIYALADVTVVVASDQDSGGTWAGATEALRRGYGTVAVWRGEGEGPGNAAIEGLGAAPIRTITDLDSIEPTPADSQQLKLID
jgi:predicted Rossmann fold nucleotide-binding protein DprA/Smf involved in DNA uptake